MGLRIELRTRYCRQNAQNFGPELLDQVPGPKNKKKVSTKFGGTRWMINEDKNNNFIHSEN